MQGLWNFLGQPVTLLRFNPGLYFSYKPKALLKLVFAQSFNQYSQQCNVVPGWKSLLINDTLEHNFVLVNKLAQRSAFYECYHITALSTLISLEPQIKLRWSVCNIGHIGDITEPTNIYITKTILITKLNI